MNVTILLHTDANSSKIVGVFSNDTVAHDYRDLLVEQYSELASRLITISVPLDTTVAPYNNIVPQGADKISLMDKALEEYLQSKNADKRDVLKKFKTSITHILGEAQKAMANNPPDVALSVIDEYFKAVITDSESYI
jgi:hypothetical protein